MVRKSQSIILFIAKGHYGTEKLRDMLLRVSNIKIFIIWREVRDQLVSYYYYLKDRRNVSFKGFDDYYWSIGYKFVIEQLEYRKVWTNVNKDPRIRVSHFALLKTDFAYEANKLFSFVGINDIDIDNIKNEVSLESFRKKSGDINGTFYRKGAIDEYKSVISNRKILDNINFIFKCDSKPAMRQLMLVYQQIKKFMMKNGET
ncbi:MAG: hypothetical protein HN561_06805 [Candidatus Scalindua sp.]|nr:hypothetical protein [Candidatus Scalindua sp.]